MLTDILDPRRQKEKPNPRSQGGKPATINMPHDPDAPIQSIELSSGSPSATQPCNDDTQNLLPASFPNFVFASEE
jgi:hypothetical protein